MNSKKNSFDEPAQVIKRADAPEEKVIPVNTKEAFSSFCNRHFSKKAGKNFIKNNIPCKDDPRKEKIRKVIMDVSFVLLVLAIIYLIFYYFSYRERVQQTIDHKTEIESYENLTPSEEKELWEDIRESYPSVEFPEGMTIKYAKLYALNQDVCGYLIVPNTNIETVLLKSGSSHPDYYLYKNIYGNYSRYGNPFVDARCKMDSDGFSKNTIIYGHNTHDGLMFHQLTDYMTLDGYKKAPVIILDTLYKRTYWKIFAVMLTNASPDTNNGYVFQYLYSDFGSDENFNEIMSGVMKRSMIKTEVGVNADDKIMTLYTCYQNIFREGRLVVFARLLREGEDRNVDVSKAYVNSAALFPQAYYDKMGTENPYADEIPLSGEAEQE